MLLLATIIMLLIRVLIYCLLARSVLSWIVYSGYQYNRNSSILMKIYNVLSAVTEPLVGPIRRYLSRFNTGAFDFAPLAAMILLMILQRIVQWVL
jgi:YggT family protein